MPHILGSWKWCKWLCLVIASSPAPSPWGREGPGDEASLVTASNGHLFLLCTFTVLLLFLFFILWPQNSVRLWLCSRTGIVHQSSYCWVPLQGRLSGLYRAYFSSGRPPQHGTCHVPLITSERWKLQSFSVTSRLAHALWFSRVSWRDVLSWVECYIYVRVDDVAATKSVRIGVKGETSPVSVI